MRAHEKSIFKLATIAKGMEMKWSDFELYSIVWSMFFPLDGIATSPKTQGVFSLFVIPMKKTWNEQKLVKSQRPAKLN